MLIRCCLSLTEVKAYFHRFDQNKDGKITKDELAVMLQQAQVAFTQNELDDFFIKVDEDSKSLYYL